MSEFHRERRGAGIRRAGSAPSGGTPRGYVIQADSVPALTICSRIAPMIAA
jgi:hypothetical protein